MGFLCRLAAFPLAHRWTTGPCDVQITTGSAAGMLAAWANIRARTNGCAATVMGRSRAAGTFAILHSGVASGVHRTFRQGKLWPEHHSRRNLETQTCILPH